MPGSPDAPRRRRSRGGRRHSRKPADATAVSAAETDAPSAEGEAGIPAVEETIVKPLTRPVPTASSADWTPADYVVEPVEGKLRFLDAGLPDTILHALADMGFEYCTPIQARVLQEVAVGHNVAGRAQTGTGKTAAFLLLTFKQFLQNPLPADRPCGKPRALILAPTRELVIQIVRDAEEIGKYSGINSIAVYGGADYDRQERELLKAPVDVVAATPGRLLDFRRKGTLDLSGVEVLVIDEADRMLDMGFIPDVRTIIRSTPPKERRRTLLFSATLSDEVMRLASQWMPDPHVVEIEPDQVAVDTVKQLVYMVRANQKFTVLYNLLKRPNMGRVLVFANRRDQTDRIAFELQRHGIECEILSGAVDQKKRMRVLEDFRSGKLRIVVATDVAGRGLHVDNIDHVVNFDLPYEAEDYVHRIGRTGRAGAEGTAVSFACEDESFGIPEIEKYMGETMSCKYPEDVLLRALPRTTAPEYVRPPRSPSSGSRSGGGRSGGSYGGGGRSRR
jgi:ATP-dependent RNA helicase RhlB